MRDNRKRNALRGLAIGLVMAAGSACGITDSEPPRLARVVADNSLAEPLELIISTDFEIILDELTGNQDPQFTSADTFAVTAPFEQSYTLADGDERLFVRFSNTTEELAPVLVQVYLDESRDWDVTATLGPGAFLEYLYRFNQPTLNR